MKTGRPGRGGLGNPDKPGQGEGQGQDLNAAHAVSHILPIYGYRMFPHILTLVAYFRIIH